jgi:hypothetical protein
MEQPQFVRSIEIILTAIALTIALGLTVVSPNSSAHFSNPLPRSNARW